MDPVSHLYSMFSTLVRIKIYLDDDESVFFFNRKFLEMWTTYLAPFSNKYKQQCVLVVKYKQDYGSKIFWKRWSSKSFN